MEASHVKEKATERDQRANRQIKGRTERNSILFREPAELTPCNEDRLNHVGIKDLLWTQLYIVSVIGIWLDVACQTCGFPVKYSTTQLLSNI